MNTISKIMYAAGIVAVSTSFCADNYDMNIRMYGVGERYNDKSYGGAGLELDSSFTRAGLEYGNGYQKAYGVYKYDINDRVYAKAGLGWLERELRLLNVDQNVRQTTGGGALGYGDNINYTLEAGYLASDLSNAANADGSARSSYVEFVGKHNFAEYVTLDLVTALKNTYVYGTNYSDTYFELGWYPVNDIRASIAYDTTWHDSNDYVLKGGVQYLFNAKGEWKPFLSAYAHTATNGSVKVEYANNIVNKPLSMRDSFERIVKTSNIVAQTVAPKEFGERINGHTPSGENFTVDLGMSPSGNIDLSSHISNLGGTNALTVNFVGAGISADAGTVTSAGITGTNAYITVSGSNPNTIAYLDYTVSDGMHTSQVYRITFLRIYVT